MLLRTTITRKWPSSCWTKERPHTQQRRYQETLTASVYWHKHMQISSKHNHMHTHILDHFRHFTFSPPTLTSEDGKLVHIFISVKRSSWKPCTFVVCFDTLLKDSSPKNECSVIIYASPSQNKKTSMTKFSLWRLKVLGHCFQSMEKSVTVLQNISFCEERKSSRLGMTWRLMNDDRTWIMPSMEVNYSFNH